jgi:hypothetical protein
MTRIVISRLREMDVTIDTSFSNSFESHTGYLKVVYTICMSRARDWTQPLTGEVFWFDAYDSEATVEQLEVLAEMEDADIDDLLDERLSTRAVLYRLNHNSGLIPHEIIEQKKARALSTQRPLACRYHEDSADCEGAITRHHFVPRWLMLELPDYINYAPRSYCTIPACTGWHRTLHLRDGQDDKSIAPYLTDAECNIADHLIESLKEVRPVLFDLVLGGDPSSYEYTLLNDWQEGKFSR